MKNYEKASSYRLPYNLPIIMRVDGRAFHTFTKDLKKPFDNRIIEMMNAISVVLCEDITGTRLAYIQSDEVSLLIYNEPMQEPWFDNKISKMTSVSAGIASAVAMKWKQENDFLPNEIVSFDSRAFIIPEHEILNYFIWRQKDWERNSLNMLARSYYLNNQLTGKKKSELHDLIYQAGDNWANMAPSLRRGRCVIKKEVIKNVENPYFSGEVSRFKWCIDNEIPIFTINKEYILNRIPFVKIDLEDQRNSL